MNVTKQYILQRRIDNIFEQMYTYLPNISQQKITAISNTLLNGYNKSVDVTQHRICSKDYLIPTIENSELVGIRVINAEYNGHYEYVENSEIHCLKTHEIVDNKMRIQGLVHLDFYRHDIDYQKKGIRFANFKMERENHHIYNDILKQMFSNFGGWFYKVTEEIPNQQYSNFYRYCTKLGNNLSFRAVYLGHVELFKDDVFKQSFSKGINELVGLQLTPDDITDDSMQSIIEHVKMLSY